MTVWDSPIDAKEFFDAYAKRTSQRYPDAKANNASSNGSGEIADWQTSQGDVIVELRQSRVLIIEGVPQNANKKGLLTTLWQ